MRSKRFIVGALIFVAFAFVWFGPAGWLALSSFKHRIDLLDWNVQLKFSPTLNNYRGAFAHDEFGTHFVNSMLVATGSALAAVIFAIPAAFGLSLRPGRNRLLFLFLSARMAPAAALALPLFLVFRSVGLVDTLLGLTLAHSGLSLGFAVWMLKGFFDELPQSFVDAASVDGLSIFMTIRLASRAILPGLATTVVFSFLFSWNEFFISMILTGRRTSTVPIAVLGLVTPAGTLWGEVAAIATAAIIPAIISMVLVRGLLARGLTFGAFREAEWQSE